MECALSEREERPTDVASILSILPDSKETEDGEERFEQSKSNGKEKGYLMMDSPCGTVEEGGMNGHKTRKR